MPRHARRSPRPRAVLAKRRGLTPCGPHAPLTASRKAARSRWRSKSKRTLTLPSPRGRGRIFVASPSGRGRRAARVRESFDVSAPFAPPSTAVDSGWSRQDVGSAPAGQGCPVGGLPESMRNARNLSAHPAQSPFRAFWGDCQKPVLSLSKGHPAFRPEQSFACEFPLSRRLRRPPSPHSWGEGELTRKRLFRPKGRVPFGNRPKRHEKGFAPTAPTEPLRSSWIPVTRQRDVPVPLALSRPPVGSTRNPLRYSGGANGANLNRGREVRASASPATTRRLEPCCE